MTKVNVLPRPRDFQQSARQRLLYGRPTGTSYKDAVREVLKDTMNAYNLDADEMADALHCSVGTIKNAIKKCPPHNLEAVTLLNIAYSFGEESIAKVRALYLCAEAAEPKTPVELFDDLQACLNRVRREAGV